MKISISTNNDNSAFILTPVDFSFSRLRGVTVFIKGLNNGILNDGHIKVPFDDSDINELYSRIIELFVKRWNCSIESDADSSSIITDAQEEAEKFELFAEKAFEIRNNSIVKEELKDFLGILDKNEFRRELKPFQLLAAYHLAFSQNACNFSVPGSGKTTTVLAAYELLRHIDDDKKRVDKLLVVGPLSAFLAWKNEFKECYGREPVCLEIRGGVKTAAIEDKLLRSSIEEELIIVSYGSLDGRRELLQRFVKNNHTMVVLDEAHRIKNVEDGVQSKAALSLSAYAKSRVVLTGTPAANSYIDLYNLYKFIWPANNIIGYSIIQLANMSKRDDDPRVPDLIRRISPFFIRVTKKDLKLPEPEHHPPCIIRMSSIQRTIYEAIEDMAISTFERTAVADIFRKSAFIRLRQAASNPRLLNKPIEKHLAENDIYIDIDIGELDDGINVDNKIMGLIKNYNEVPCKFEAAYNLTQKIIENGGKIIIWCEFIGTCIDLEDYLKSRAIRSEILFGGTSQEDREKIIIDFHSNSKLSVIIANPHAVGEAISLHLACHNALYLEQGFNAGVYMQSKDRIHRVGLQDDVVTNYYYFHAADSIDKIAYDRVMLKEGRMLDLIENEEIPLLSKNEDFMDDMEDDIKSLIRAYYERKKRNI